MCQLGKRHWKPRVIIMPTLSSMAALQWHCGGAVDGKVGIMIILGSQWMSCWIITPMALHDSMYHVWKNTSGDGKCEWHGMWWDRLDVAYLKLVFPATIKPLLDTSNVTHLVYFDIVFLFFFRSEQNGCHCADGIFKRIFIEEKFCDLIQLLMIEFIWRWYGWEYFTIHSGQAWRWKDDKSLHEPMLT